MEGKQRMVSEVKYDLFSITQSIPWQEKQQRSPLLAIQPPKGVMLISHKQNDLVATNIQWKHSTDITV